MKRPVVVVPSRGVVRWRPDGTRLVVPFPGASGRRFFDEVDDVLLAAPRLSPVDQAAQLVERIAGAEIRPGVGEDGRDGFRTATETATPPEGRAPLRLRRRTGP